MLNLRNSKGFTLVEIILVVLIIGVLAALIIPRINFSQNKAKTAVCDANVARINSVIEYQYVKNGVAYPTTNALLTTYLQNKSYFPDGQPLCPYGDTYVLVTDGAATIAGRVAKHNHPID